MNNSETLDNSNKQTSKWGQFIKRKVLQHFEQITHGCLTVTDGDERHQFGQEPASLHASIEVINPSFYTDLAFKGSVGAAESFAMGDWDSPNPALVTELFAINRSVTDGMEGGSAWLMNLLAKGMHRFNKNSRQGSQKNIADHYDLGNELFRLFLDSHMMYSSAIYVEPSDTLEVASERKLRTVCEKLDLKADDHLLEIGTGWGGMAIYAAMNYGCQVTTTTISEEQYQLAKAKVQAMGLTEQITLLKKDYRDLTGQYDKLVSIEMIEAVGHQYLDQYSEQLGRLLKPDGLALIQAITIEDSRYPEALRTVDFIKKHIFPGSFIPCVSVILSSLARKSALKPVHLEDFGESYSRTLKHWKQRFVSRSSAVEALGYDRYFQRMWQFYFDYCVGGFEARCISVVHLLLAAPENRKKSLLALS